MLESSHTIEKLLGALEASADSIDSYNVREAAKAVNKSAFDHLFYDYDHYALMGDGMAMSSLLVAFNTIDLDYIHVQTAKEN